MQKKKGISLIVLVITIIVMIILAASVVITLSNTGVINRASEAVDLTNEASVQDLAALTWADAYMNNKRGTELVSEVTTKLGEQGVTADKWNITVTDTGVSVTNKNSASESGLGSLIKGPEDYGKTVDYTVSVNGKTYDNWQIYYEDEKNGNVFLILKESLESRDIGMSVLNLTSEELELYSKFQVGNGEKWGLFDKASDGREARNCEYIADSIRAYGVYANRTDYGEYVVGAIGGPTIELLAAGYNAYHKTNAIIPLKDATYSTDYEYGYYGYYVNELGRISVTNLINDDLYLKSEETYRILSPNANEDRCGCDFIWQVGSSSLSSLNIGMTSAKTRPVVCLKSSIPATVGTGDYDFELTK